MASPKKSNTNNTIAKSSKNNFYSFLEDHRVKSDKDRITHTSWGKIMGKYSIPDEDMETFYKLYEKEVIGNKKFGLLNIIEQHKEISPIIIDIDFKFDENINERMYTNEHIEKIVKLYMKEIEETFVFYSKTYELIAFVFQRNEPYKFKGDTRDGIHIMFPFIISEPNIQYIIRENIIKKVQNDKILEDIPFKNQLTDVFDRSIIAKNGWFMYGSSKPYCKPYQLTHVYDYHMELIDPIDVEYRGINSLAKFLSIRRHKKEDCQEIRETKFDDLERLEKRQTAFQLNQMKKIHSNTYDIKQISQLVNILSPKRWENYKPWIKVGWCLHNIDSNNIELLNLWIEFSKNWSQFKPGECEKEWSRFRKHGKLLGIGSLHHWAKKDNPDKYLDIRRQDIRYYIDKSINCTNYDVARVLYEMFRYQFVYDKNKIWYEFKNHRWHEDEHGISLRQKISNDLVNEYIKIISDYNVMIVKLDNDPELTEEEKDKEKTKYEEKGKLLTSITLKLKTTNFKDNIMKECKELFYEKDFSKKLDEHNYLIGFEDGVYDLEAGEFREGIPEDYICKTTGNYYLEYDENNPQIEDIMEFVRQIFPVYDVRHYILKMFASMLQGYNAEEKFRIWTGCHAKGTEIMMFDGTCKKVEDIVESDQLMGDDSTPRDVLKLARGYSDMYKITPISAENEAFIVNGDHIMCLKAAKIGNVCNIDKEFRWKVIWQERDRNGYPINKGKNFPYKNEGAQIYRKNVKYYENKDEAEKAARDFYEQIQQSGNFIKEGDIIEIPVREYLKRVKKIGKRNYFGYHVGVEYPEKKVDLDPYMLGYWIGDSTAFVTMDKEEALRKYNLVKNKHIPHVYKCNSREIRLQVLAGILDSDGHYQRTMGQYELTMKSGKIVDDVVDLCRSLGFACSKNKIKKGMVTETYYQIQICGIDLTKIPVLVPRKKAERRLKDKNPLLFGFDIKKVEDDNYYGFLLNGNHRYLLKEHVVTHNSGANGKGKLLELFSLATGEYTKKMDIALLTGKRATSNAATPEVAEIKGARCLIFDEPEEGANINVGLMKEYSGGDKVKGRALFRAPIEFKPQFKMILLCNDLPKVPPYDGGVWRRLEVTECTSKFVDKPKEEGEYLRDYHLSEKLKDWKESFMSILLHYHRIYVNEGLEPPQEVTKFTREYQLNSDIYTEFIETTLEKVEDKNKKAMVPISEIYREFKLWYQEENHGMKAASRREFKSYLIKRFSKKNIQSDYLKGYILHHFERKTSEEEAKDEDSPHVPDLMNDDEKNEDDSEVIEV